MRLIVDSEITCEDVPVEVEDDCVAQLVIPNPEVVEKENQGRWVDEEIPRTISYIEKDGATIKVPRGFLNELKRILEFHNIAYSIKDKTRILPQIDLTFNGKLGDLQEEAKAAMMRTDIGILLLLMGSGKTVISLSMVAERGQPALVIVKTKELMYQWRDEAHEFLGMEKGEIGLFGDGHKKLGSKLTIGIINSVHKYVTEISEKVGFLIIDECQHAPAKRWRETIQTFDCKYLLGLTATDYRRDGLDQVIRWLLGDVVYTLEPKILQNMGYVMRPVLVRIKTKILFEYNENDPSGYPKMLRKIITDEHRNQLILEKILNEIRQNTGIALVISDRIKHCNSLYHELCKHGIETRLLTGKVAAKRRKEIVNELRSGSVRVLVGTTSLLSEGFNLKQLSSIFITCPMRFAGKTEQSVGRILRTAEGKISRPRVYDFVDETAILKSSYWARYRVYKKLGILDDNFLKDFNANEKPIEDQGHEQKSFAAWGNLLSDY